MKKTYEQVLKQIEELQVQAENLRRSEVTGVIERIRDAISHYKLTAADLGLGNAGKAAKGGKSSGGTAAQPKQRKAGKKPGAKAPPVVKFRNDSGGTWGGIGKRPDWLREALASGKTLQDFLVK